jgi:hypothetical protein
MIDWHHDKANSRMWAMWEDEAHRFRVNIVEHVGGRVPLHVHKKHGHTMMVPAGVFRITMRDPDGAESVRMVGAPHLGAESCHLWVGRGVEHELVLVKQDPGIPGAAWCITPKERGF